MYVPVGLPVMIVVSTASAPLTPSPSDRIAATSNPRMSDLPVRQLGRCDARVALSANREGPATCVYKPRTVPKTVNLHDL